MPKGNPSTPTSTKSSAPSASPMADDLPLLPPGWVWTTIGNVTSPVEKVDPREQPDLEFVYLDISSIDNHTHRIVAPKRYRGRDAPSRARQLVRKHDVLFSTVRVYLRNIALVPPQYDGQIASTGFAVLRGNQTIEPKYLFFYTLTDDFIERLNHLQRGTSYPAVRDKDVRAQFIPLAPLPEQRRIVAKIEELFSQLDAVEEGLRRVQRNLKRYRAAVLKAAVEGRLVPTEAELARREGRPYETGEELLQRILAERRHKWEEQEWAKLVEKAKKKAAQARRKARGLPARIKDIPPEEWQAIPEGEYRRYLPKDDRWKQKYKEPTPPDTTNLPPLPEGWVWATLGELVTPSAERADPNSLTLDTLYIGLEHIEKETGELIGHGRATEVRSAKNVFRAGDVLYGKLRPYLNKVCIPDFDGVCSTDILVFPKQEYLDNRFLKYRLLASDFVQYASIHVSGVQHPRVHFKQLAKFPVALPPLAEQRRIVAEVERRLSVAREAEKAVEANLKRIARLRQAILKRAFEGKLVPQDPNDEPAEILIAKIQEERNKHLAKKTKSIQHRRKDQVKQTKVRRPIYEVLQLHQKPMPPEDLLREAGFDENTIEEFYEELRQEVRRERIREQRSQGQVFLEVVKHAD